MTTLNMGTARLCVFLAVLVSVNMVASQPIFGSRMWCDMFCDDDDYDSSDSSSYEDFDIFSIFDPCSGCGSKKPSKSKTTTMAPPGGMQQPFNLVIPPANGMNVTMTNTGSSWLMNFLPWAAKPEATKAPAATTAAPATTGAKTTSGAKTTAAGSTTAAPKTTAKK